MYQRPIYIYSILPGRVVETVSEDPIVSKKAALAQTLLIKGYESEEEIDVQQITLMYYMKDQIEGERYACPCWRVQYRRNGGN